MTCYPRLLPTSSTDTIVKLLYSLKLLDFPSVMICSIKNASEDYPI